MKRKRHHPDQLLWLLSTGRGAKGPLLSAGGPVAVYNNLSYKLLAANGWYLHLDCLRQPMYLIGATCIAWLPETRRRRRA